MTSKRQVTVPKEIADRFHIRPGDEIEWVPAGSEIRVLVPGGQSLPPRTVDERLHLFDQASQRRRDREAGRRGPGKPRDRGWTREEIYRRGRAG